MMMVISYLRKQLLLDSATVIHETGSMHFFIIIFHLHLTSKFNNKVAMEFDEPD